MNTTGIKRYHCRLPRGIEMNPQEYPLKKLGQYYSLFGRNSRRNSAIFMTRTKEVLRDSINRFESLSASDKSARLLMLGTQL